ncbi:ABC transporter permease [Candidatus Bathyarchaeota archaeon]|nr:ABC transporter permease [Candidatus Bathyarchaeota archaeon]
MFYTSRISEKVSRKPKFSDRFLAVVKYELLWNIRKKKFLGVLIAAFAFSTLSLLLPVILSYAFGAPLEANPNFVIGRGGISSGFTLFLFALVSAMNSISGEFESGTIIPLMTKPVSRSIIFFGKVFSSLITISAAYSLLYAYMAIGGTVIYGPQNNLHLMPLCILGDLLSTFVWISIVLALGSLSKNTILTAISAIIVFLAISISAPIVSVFSEGAWILNYVPGNGASGYVKGANQGMLPGTGVTTGTDSITSNLVRYVLNPSEKVTYFKVEVGAGIKELYSEPLSAVLSRSMLVALAYITILTFTAWYAFKNAQVLE